MFFPAFTLAILYFKYYLKRKHTLKCLLFTNFFSFRASFQIAASAASQGSGTTSEEICPLPHTKWQILVIGGHSDQGKDGTANMDGFPIIFERVKVRFFHTYSICPLPESESEWNENVLNAIHGMLGSLVIGFLTVWSNEQLNHANAK